MINGSKVAALDIGTLARITRLQVLLHVNTVQLEAMRSANISCMYLNVALQYTEEDFKQLGRQMLNVVSALEAIEAEEAQKRQQDEH